MTRARQLKIGKAIGALALSVILAFVAGFVNDTLAKLYPAHAYWIDNAVAVALVFPLVYWVFVPFFAAFDKSEKEE